MAKLQPWYKVVTPREDLREGKPLDASEFAVHLDQVRKGMASDDYQKPEQFFERTYFTKNLLKMAAEVVRRLSGEKTATSAVFNMATQFGGGKTHALTALYHLAEHGAAASKWQGVGQVLTHAGVKEVPAAATAVFVGTEFDSIKGRGGDDGTPRRKTPWGEIAFQLSGEAGFRTVEEHEKQMIAPAGEVIRSFLATDRPSLILVDELMNYVSRNRKSGLATQLYSFIQNLSEVARGSDNVVLVVSIPASELEMSAEDQSDYERLHKMLDRVGKAVMMSAEAETSEIIRRRLFEWDPKAVSQDGRVLLSQEALMTAREYAEWLQENRAQIPGWFPVDHAQSTFESTYPFHPAVLSVFERKWQELPRFQQTRGVLRLLALWVSHAYQQAFKRAEQVPLIGLGSAPLEEPIFRSALFEQLGESKLEGPVTTDICGKRGSHAVRLDDEAVDTIRKARLHRKAAISIFFESNGGQSRNEASLPEVRLAVAGPHVDLGNVETALEALSDACYYLTTEGSRYRFSTRENLTKRYADRRATIQNDQIDQRVREEIQGVFPRTDGIEILPFPEKSSQIQDRPVITLVVMGPDHAVQDDPRVVATVEGMTKEHGKSARTYKSALIWAVPESAASMREAARKSLAWEAIQAEGLKLDDSQRKQLGISLEKGRRDLTESVWRSYKNVLLLGKDNSIKTVDLGLVTSSSHSSLPGLILERLRQTDEVDKGPISARFLVRNWPPAFTEWSTKAVHDAFYASPLFPRLLDPATIKDTVARGVTDGLLAYVGKSPKGYDPFVFRGQLTPLEVEISDDVFIIKAEEAEKHLQPPELTGVVIQPPTSQLKPGEKQAFAVEALDQFGQPIEAGEVSWEKTGGEISAAGVFTAGKDLGSFSVTVEAGGIISTASVTVFEGITPPPPSTQMRLIWEGDVPHQKWTNFYMKILSGLVSKGTLSLRLRVEAEPDGGATDAQAEELRSALRGLGIKDEVELE